MASKVAKSLPRKRKGLKHAAGDKNAVVYIGHMPQGFEEKEILRYFKQFGNVRRVKVSRTLKNGKSKGYGFVQFENEDVAKIAAETMNNYIMFQKSLKAHVVDKEKVHDSLFKITGRGFSTATAKRRAIAIKKFNKVEKEPDTKTLRKRRRKEAARQRLLESVVGDQFAAASQRKPRAQIVASAHTITRTKQQTSARDSLLSATQQESSLAIAESALKQKHAKPKTPQQVDRIKKEGEAFASLAKSLSKVKTPNINRKAVKMAVTPTIIGREADMPSTVEISFKTPTEGSPSAGKVKTSAKRVFPKTPVPSLHKSHGDEATSEAGLSRTQAHTASSKKSQTPLSKKHAKSEEKSEARKAKVQTSDASPALYPKTAKVSREPNKEPSSKKARSAAAPSKSEKTSAKTKKSPKFSPRVTRGALTKKATD